MKEIEAVPWNGYKVVSTFSGGGGSCLGYRMAGYKVAWANEFIPAAQDTYRANHPGVFLNCRDIRQVTAGDIVQETGIPIGGIDLFDGSPPCAAFSTAGKRDKYWGKVKNYSDTTQRVDDLFFEYARLVKELQPKVFVAENVSGLIKGSAKGYFKIFMRTLKDCGYEVKVRLLDAKYLGVPQNRQRVIFVGVRNDLVEKFGVHPAHPKPLSRVITLGEALQGVVNSAEELDYSMISTKYASGRVLRKLPKNPKKPITGASVMNGSYFNLRRESMYCPSGTICQMTGAKGLAGNCHPLYDRKFTISELKRITSVPDDFTLTGNEAQQWERLGRMVPPVMMSHIAKTIEKEILNHVPRKYSVQGAEQTVQNSDG